MGILRILLVLGLITGCSYLALRAPWVARLDPTATSIELGAAPVWAPPAEPPLSSFPGFVKTPEIPREEGVNVVVDTGVKIVVELDRRAFFGKACVVIIGLFFLFGFAGTIIQRRPETTDVAFSLWLSIGLLGGIVVSATIGHMGTKTSLPFFSECMLAGFVVGLLIALKSAARLPLAKRKGKTRGGAGKPTA